MELNSSEKKLVNRIARQKQLYLTVSIINVVIAVVLLVYYGLIATDSNSLRFVIVILILLSGKTHMRQYRSALIIFKLKQWLDNKEGQNETYVK